ncbi:AI-2E family transporter [candidate division KSB1 bacterium]|nr:AI-2E family transporter [candidate division KSB1 bacterium]
MNLADTHPLVWIASALFLIFLIYHIRTILTPLVLFASLVLLLLPLRSILIVRRLFLVLGLIFVVWFVQASGGILLPFVLSFGLAYLFDPLVTFFEAKKIPRWLSVVAIVLLVLGLASLLSLFLIPQILQQLGDLVTLSIKYSNKISDWIEGSGLQLLTRYIRLDDGKLQDFVLNQLPDKVQQLFEAAFKSAVNITSGVSAAIGQLVNLVLVPFLFFYLLKDFTHIRRGFHRLLPPNDDSRLQKTLDSVGTIVSAFFRGQLIVCTIVGILTTAGLALFGIRYALILGLLAGILNIIPYVGLAITLVFGVLVGFLSPSPFLAILKIVGVIEVVQILESSVLSPRIVGDRVGLHPVWVIFSILVFSHFFGFWGLLIAVPAGAVIRVFIGQLLQFYSPGLSEPKDK